MISAKLLLSVTILALFVSNSPFRSYYDSFFHASIFNHFNALPFQVNLSLVINDGLMTIFFLIVGLEIKYELLSGALNSLHKATLPGISAIGGMAIPAVIYAFINRHDSTMLRGWAAPMATDIAFSLSVLSLLGSKIPSTLKTFLTALAILDDLAAIIIIAIFYTDQISVIFLGLALACLLILFTLNKSGVTSLSVYSLIGFILWVFLFKSGIHPTLAGVGIALMVPLKNKKKLRSPLKKLQHTLHPWVALGILPLFAFANAGVSVLHLGQAHLHVSIILGILFGLFLGKQLGIFGAAWLAVQLGIATLPDRVRWNELYAVAIICGIGFTISLFIGTLAFSDDAESYLNSLKIGVLTGSVLSGIVGYLLLLLMHVNKKTRQV
jgi:NhaA family Na+:H+ antiporter